jgi:hypothetical protein
MHKNMETDVRENNMIYMKQTQDNGLAKKKNHKEFLKRNVHFVVKIASIHMQKLNYVPVSKLKVGYGWVGCFKTRHNLTIRHQMTIAQRLPEAYEKELVTFQKYVLKLRKQHEYLLGQLGNINQTPLYLTYHTPQQLTPPANEQCR